MFALTLLDDPIYYVFVVFIVVLSVTLHELGHALAAYAEGDDTAKKAGHFTLNPVVHMGVQSLVLLLLIGVAWGLTPVNPNKFRHAWGDLAVSLAGPFTNLILMLIFLLLFFGLRHGGWGLPEAVLPLLALFCFLGALMNAALFLLNMLPVPPLDGFSILKTLVPAVREDEARFGGYGLFILLIAFFIFGLGRLLFDGADWLIAQTYQLLFHEALLT